MSGRDARRRTLSLPTVVVFALACALAGCSRTAEEVRRHTYPSNFEYLEGEHVREHMVRVTHDVAELDGLLRAPKEHPAARERVVAVLADLEKAVEELGAVGRPTNHPLLDAGREAFVGDVRAARAAVEREPPDYFLAGNVAGACARCHH